MSETIQRYVPGTMFPRNDKNGDYVLFSDHEAAINDLCKATKEDKKKITDDWVAYVDKLREDYQGRVQALEAYHDRLADKNVYLGITTLLSTCLAIVLAAKIWL